MLDEAKKLIGVDYFVIQTYIQCNKRKPKIFRVDIGKKDTIVIHKLKEKPANDHTLSEMQNAVVERKVNFRRLSEVNDKLLLLNIKEDQVTKHCVSSMDSANIRIKKLAGAKVPEIESEALKIRDYFDKYVFAPGAFKINRFVIDFVPGNDGNLYFLQIKHYEAENKLLYDPKMLNRIRIKKGLQTKPEQCQGIFCKDYSTNPALKELCSQLIANGSISKQWNRYGVYIVPLKLINEYQSELSEYFEKFGIKNILSSLVYVDLEKRSGSLEFNRKIIRKEEYDPQHVCELCHRIFKMFMNKNEITLSTDRKIIESLFALSQRPCQSWSSSEITFLIELYGRTLPSLSHMLPLSLRKKQLLRNRNDFYGYRSIVEAPLLDLTEDNPSRYQCQSSRNYVKLNIRSCSNPSSRRKPKEFIFTNSAAPKVSAPEEIRDLYKLAETSQKHLIKRIKKSISKGVLE